MKRILIIGSPGAGKSTVSRRLSDMLGLPVVHLDQLFWDTGWKLRPHGEFLSLVNEALAGESWIMDGNYASTLRVRLKRADAVVYLDFPTRICLWRILKRIVTGYGGDRPDMADGCPERFDREFLWYVLRIRKNQRSEVEEILREVKHPGVFRATRSGDVEAWIECLNEPADQTGSSH